MDGDENLQVDLSEGERMSSIGGAVELSVDLSLWLRGAQEPYLLLTDELHAHETHIVSD